MEKYSKAVSEMNWQFKNVDAHPMEKYVGKHAAYRDKALEVVGFVEWSDGTCSLIVDAPPIGGWEEADEDDVVFKECESYLYALVEDLID